jgi:hypothetical protein
LACRLSPCPERRTRPSAPTDRIRRAGRCLLCYYVASYGRLWLACKSCPPRACRRRPKPVGTPLAPHPLGSRALLAGYSRVHPLCTPCAYGPITLTLAGVWPAIWRAFRPVEWPLALLSRWKIRAPVQAPKCRPSRQARRPLLHGGGDQMYLARPKNKLSR